MMDCHLVDVELTFSVTQTSLRYHYLCASEMSYLTLCSHWVEACEMSKGFLK